jgi:hypothetical protein
VTVPARGDAWRGRRPGRRPEGHGRGEARTLGEETVVLLDRKRIRRWAKWVALGLAIVFVLGFVVGGIGYGSGDFSLVDALSLNCSGSAEPEVADTVLVALLASHEAAPEDTAVMIEIADYYLGLYDAEDSGSITNLDKAAEFMEEAISVDPSLTSVYLDLAQVYSASARFYENLASYAAAGGDSMSQSIYSSSATEAYKNMARVLNKATSVDPQNPEVYLYLGIAQRGAGETGEAILAWQKYLQLAPDGAQAQYVRSEVARMTAPSTTTTTGATTTTTVSTTSTTAE